MAKCATTGCGKWAFKHGLCRPCLASGLVKQPAPSFAINLPRSDWFSDLFGFSDQDGSYTENKGHFHMEGEELVCENAPFPRQHVGPWETPSLAELRERHPHGEYGVDELTFRHLATTFGVEPLILDPSNTGAVFMVASQFNALEMISPDRTPSDGVAIYMRDKTQGPVCAMACPAATVFRNYLCQDGVGQGEKQLDLLAGVGDVVGNINGRYWTMRNGYAMPTTPEAFLELSRQLRNDKELCAAAESALRVGVHAETQVKPPLAHRVAQVFCSALPVAYCRGKIIDELVWEPFARLVLRAAYEATLAIGAGRAASSSTGRAAIFLTAIGDGAFGNKTAWVREALVDALDKYRTSPLDVTLVHYGSSVAVGWLQAGVPGVEPPAVHVCDPAAEARARFASTAAFAALLNKSKVTQVCHDPPVTEIANAQVVNDTSKKVTQAGQEADHQTPEAGQKAGPQTLGKGKALTKPFEQWDVNEVCRLVQSIDGVGFAEAANAIKEYGIDGKYFSQMLRNNNDDLTISIKNGGLGFKRLQLKVVKAKIDESQGAESWKDSSDAHLVGGSTSAEKSANDTFTSQKPQINEGGTETNQKKRQRANKASLWPKQKMEAGLAAKEAGEAPARGLAVVLTTGGMNPVHRGHVMMLHQAANRLETAGYGVIGAWLSPSHDLYLQPKAKGMRTVGLSAAFRVEAVRRTVAKDPLVAVGYWESSTDLHPEQWPDFPEVCKALQTELANTVSLARKHVTVFYACGTDHAEKCGLYRGGRSWGVVVVPRAGERPQTENTENLVFVAEQAQGEIAAFNSTSVRAALKSNDHHFIASALSPEAAQFLLTPTADELKDFSADFRGLNVKTQPPAAKEVTEPAAQGNMTPQTHVHLAKLAKLAQRDVHEPRHMYISLSALLRKFNELGMSLLQNMKPNALFCFGSKRSWIFPKDEDELKESRDENPSYTSPQNLAVRDLILAKEAMGQVFFLKPPDFKYNGSLYHGDPGAFEKVSKWLVSLDDPITGEKYKPLNLDEEWWVKEWDKSTHKYTSSATTIVKNFKNGAHDYAPVKELIHQSNRTFVFPQ